MLAREHRMVQRQAEHLVRTAARVVAALAVDDVVQVAALGIPEAPVEALRDALRARSVLVAGLAHERRPRVHPAQRVVPERLDLDRLATAWRDDPVADLRIHPGELVARGAGMDQLVRGIDADIEA